MNDQDVSTFIEGVEKIKAHVDHLKKQEESSFKISPYRKDVFGGPIMAFKGYLECCICMDMSKKSGTTEVSVFSCSSDHLICEECVRHVEGLSCPVCREDFGGKVASRNFLAERVIDALNILRADPMKKVPLVRRMELEKVVEETGGANLSESLVKQKSESLEIDESLVEPKFENSTNDLNIENSTNLFELETNEQIDRGDHLSILNLFEFGHISAEAEETDGGEFESEEMLPDKSDLSLQR